MKANVTEVPAEQEMKLIDNANGKPHSIPVSVKSHIYSCENTPRSQPTCCLLRISVAVNFESHIFAFTCMYMYV